MAKYSYHRLDGNHRMIVQALEQAGASVKALGRPVDVLVGYRGLTVPAELKTARGKLKKAQREFFDEWRGSAVILRSEDDALNLLASMRLVLNYVPGAVLGYLRSSLPVAAALGRRRAG